MTADRTLQMLPIGALLSGGDDELVEVPCRRCGAATKIAKWILDAVKSWNREELDLQSTEREAGRRHMAQFIGKGEIVTCMPCTPAERAAMSAASTEDCIRATMYLNQARNGTLDADDEAVAWLIGHGYRRQLEAMREAAKATKPIPKKKREAQATFGYGYNGGHGPSDAPHPADGES